MKNETQLFTAGYCKLTHTLSNLIGTFVLVKAEHRARSRHDFLTYQCCARLQLTGNQIRVFLVTSPIELATEQKKGQAIVPISFKYLAERIQASVILPVHTKLVIFT